MAGGGDAARPLEVDEADTVEPGKVEVEFGFELEIEANAKTPAAPSMISLKIPTADEQRGLGTGKVDATLLLIAIKTFSEDQQLDFNLGDTLTR